MIYIFSSKKAAALGLGEKSSWAEILPLAKNFPQGNEPQADDQVYLDISGLSPVMRKKTIGLLKKSRAGAFWGIIDPKGEAEDPAAFFFEGARDYIGPALVKKGVSKKRFAAAGFQAPEKKPDMPPGKTKPPDVKFAGWKSLRSGTKYPFFFLFVTVAGRSSLRSRVGDSAFGDKKKRLCDLLQQALGGADALLWMETEDNCLFLVPPEAPNARAAVEASLKIILNSRLTGIEKLGLSFPLGFTIALHYGETVFLAPGKTGTIVSETVNYIFHLGAKKAEAGRLTISGAVSEEALPQGLVDLFHPAGVFEGLPIRHSRRFVYW